MAQVLTSISGLPISAASAGYAPTNSGDVSAIASAYVESGVSSKLDTSAQVVTSIGSGNWLGNDCIDHINGHYIHASDAGVAYMDEDFRQLSALPDSAAVSAIASAYQVVSSTASQLYAGTAYLTEVNGAPVSASRAGQAANASMATSAYYDGTGRLISSLPDAAAVSSIASSYAESAASSKADASSLSSYALSSDVSGVIDTVSSNSASWSGGSLPITGSAGYESGIYDANYVEFTRYLPVGEPDIRTARLTPDYFSIDYILDGNDYTSMMLSDSMLSFTLPDGTRSVNAYSIDTWNSAVDTVSSNSASWGQGGVDSATVSAIASAYQVVSALGYKPYEDDEENILSAVTSINGNLLFADSAYYAQSARTAKRATIGEVAFLDWDGRDLSALPGSAEVSAIASSYAESAVSSKLDTTAQVVSATAGDGTYVTSINGMGISGQGGGATGDYVEKSATEVGIGTNNSATTVSFAQGYTNSAHMWALAQGYGNSASNYSFAQGQYNRAKNDSFAQGSGNSASFDSFAQGFGNSATSVSFIQGQYNSASSLSFAQGSGNSANKNSFAQGLSNSAINTAAVFGRYNLRGDGNTSSGNSAAFAIGDGTAATARHDLMLVTKDGEITMYSSTADTTGTGIMSSLRAISAAATGGGVDSATVSSIASSYAESAVSSKADSSAMSSYVPYSSLEYNTASAISGINGSALAAGSTYSAGEGIDITDDVISVETPVDIVAGPGIVIDNPDGNTLRVSVAQADETVLWDGEGTGSTSATLSESILNFETIKIVYAGAERHGGSLVVEFVPNSSISNYGIELTDWFINSAGSFLVCSMGFYTVSVDGKTLTGAQIKHMWFTIPNMTYSGTGTSGVKLFKIIGCNRIASN